MNKSNSSRCRLLAWVATGLFVLGCGGAQGTGPDDMSAEEHRRAADGHEQEAADEEAQYDGDAVSTRPTSSDGDPLNYLPGTYNPTQHHLRAAGDHRDVAEQHRRAAQALESYEEAACGAFPPSTRALCPLLGQLTAVEDVDGGARLTFDSDIDPDAVHAHVACHVAFARSHGREGMDHCPMYVEGVRAERGADGSTVLRVDDDAALGVVRRRARAHLPQAE